MSGRTYFLMQDASWYTRDEVRRAARAFGPTGTAVMNWLECAAKRENVAGRVKAGAFTIADEIGGDEVTVSDVVRHLVTRRWLTDYEEDGSTFKATIAWFVADQERGLHAKRQSEYRDRQKGPENQTVTNRHAPSQTVTSDEKSREEITERANALSSARVKTELEKATGEDRASCRLFYSLGRQRNSKMKVPRDGSREQTAALKAMRLLRERDGQSTADIQRLTRWVFTDESDDAVFWGTTIQAPSGLKKNFSAAWSKMAAAETGASNGATRVLTAADLVAQDQARRAATKDAA